MNTTTERTITSRLSPDEVRNKCISILQDSQLPSGSEMRRVIEAMREVKGITTPPPAAPLPLVERVAAIIREALDDHEDNATYIANVVLALVEPEIREECAKIAEDHRSWLGEPTTHGHNIAAAIRARKP